MYYAETDRFTGDNPGEYTHGFANTKCALAFPTRAARDEWVKETKLMTAKAITRSEALKMTGWARGEHYGTNADQVKAVRIYSQDVEQYHILAAKNY
jgi:hypothetical protein